MHQHLGLVLFSAVVSHHPPSLPVPPQLKLKFIQPRQRGWKEGRGGGHNAAPSLVFERRRDEVANRSGATTRYIFRKSRAERNTNGGGWKVRYGIYALMADRVGRFSRSSVSRGFDHRFVSSRAVTFPICVCVSLSSIFFSFLLFLEKQGWPRQWPARPRRVFQFTLYRGQIAR